ncbi:MAG: hypothetical protein ACI8Z1_002464 [Candidatus Azotimanducaceae bacterium]
MGKACNICRNLDLDGRIRACGGSDGKSGTYCQRLFLNTNSHGHESLEVLRNGDMECRHFNAIIKSTSGYLLSSIHRVKRNSKLICGSRCGLPVFDPELTGTKKNPFCEIWIRAKALLTVIHSTSLLGDLQVRANHFIYGCTSYKWTGRIIEA